MRRATPHSSTAAAALTSTAPAIARGSRNCAPSAARAASC
jgi:hypothetical protein